MLLENSGPVLWMKTIFPYYPLLIILAPLLAGLMIGPFGGLIGKKVYRIGVLAHVIAFGLALCLFYEVVALGPQIFDVFPYTGQWSGIWQFRFYIDRLAAVMMVHILAISSLIHLFSRNYMQQERGFARFYSLLALSTFALLGMVASANLVMLFIFWQLLSALLSFLSYNYTHAATVRGAFRTFTLLRFGDIAFLAGIVLANALYGTLDMQQLAVRAAELHAVYSLWPGSGLEMNGVTLVTLLIFIGAMSKSAQFPLHMWLPDSLYAPTPVHALLHAGIINAGGFLLTRLAPLYDLSPTTLHVVFAMGLLTALLGSSMMLTQNDIKKTLGYSTIGQMGFMIMECGLGAYALAIFHLIAHGIFKATIFLNCGSVIHGARAEPRFPPRDEAAAGSEFSSLTWITGFITTLILPLIILLTGHGVLQIPLRDSHGAVIFLFFGWVTSSQAILTLYRLRAVASWKVAAAMLLTLFLVVLTYLLAAESFTHFLFPAPGEAAHHFKAGALPGAVFDVLVAAAALVIILGWTVIYANSHGRSIRLPLRVNALEVHLYLLLMNRLYLDALSLRIGRRMKHAARYLNTSRLFPYLASATAVIVAAFMTSEPVQLPAAKIILLGFSAAMLPLFPLQGLYVAAVTRPPATIAACFAVLLPTAGLLGLMNALPGLPAELLRGIRALALFGALYGSFRALEQPRFIPLAAYASLSFYSVLWWHIASAGSLPAEAALYFSAAALVTVGLLLAWGRVQARYGDRPLDQMPGLARPMPRFATIVALLALAAAGLPPFGLFSGYLGMLLHLGGAVSWDLGVVLVSWFAASFCFFRLMQQLLFGVARSEIPYEDLSLSETVPVLLVVFVLLAIGLLPYGYLESRPLLEMTRLWIK
jgi:NADH-quinone oxidoreductase subunit L